MAPLSGLGLLAAVLLSGSGAAQSFGDLDVSAMRAELRQKSAAVAAGGAICAGAGTPQESCSCARGYAGPKKLKVHHYAHASSEFILDRFADATVAFGAANVLLRRDPGGVLLSPARAKGGRDPENAPPNFKIDAMDEMCAVVIDALKREPPRPGSLPVFFMSLGQGFKKSVFTHANGVTYSQGLLERCRAVGESVPDEVRAALGGVLVVIDAEPEQVHKHVLAHEIGHAIGQRSGASKRLFDDIRDRSVENIMVTERGLEREQMKLNAFQVKALCASPYLADEA